MLKGIATLVLACKPVNAIHVSSSAKPYMWLLLACMQVSSTAK